MKRYLVTLEKEEREELAGITRKGSHQSQKGDQRADSAQLRRGRVQRAPGARGRPLPRSCASVRGRWIASRSVSSKRAWRRHSAGGRGRRPRYLRKADGEFEARLVALSCAEPPQGHSQWSLRLLADRVVELGHIDSVSHETVRRVLKKNELKPWRRVGWVIPPQGSADFAAAMEKVLDVYRRPYDAAFPVVCMDETPRQLIGETRAPVPAAPGRPAREDYEYRRCGTCNVFMATQPLAGRRMTKVTARRTKTDWAHFLNDIAARLPGAKRITLVMDNLNTHRPGALYEAFPPAEAKALWDRFEFVYTPKHGSWLNVAEVELSVMIRQCLNRRIDSIDILRDEVAAWQASRDRLQAKVNWQFTTDDARIKLKRLYPTLDE